MARAAIRASKIRWASAKKQNQGTAGSDDVTQNLAVDPERLPDLSGVAVGLTPAPLALQQFLFCSCGGRRRSRPPKREQNAVPDNWHRVGAP
ncbi:MAG: hypothetical protein K2Z80_38155, partial [Xanthobacteraceae bacterium]|nr:hypothetical protein [Xanthobacteraceae bacterium]MBX9847617.1 hypothetical protein [Xanthobacteraceae bacterium]